MTSSRATIVIAIAATLQVCALYAQSLDQCDDATLETNADCDNLSPCDSGETGVCYDSESIYHTYGYCVNPCGAGTQQCALKKNAIRLKGTCHNGWWDDGCLHCGEYYCVQLMLYEYKDSNGECINLLCLDYPLLGEAGCKPEN